MVSDKMVEAAKSILYSEEEYSGDLSDGTEFTRRVVSACIDKAWTKFSADNPDTWPENEAVGILVKCAESPHGYEVCWFEGGTFYSTGIPVREPIEYLSINDIKPSWIKEE